MDRRFALPSSLTLDPWLSEILGKKAYHVTDAAALGREIGPGPDGLREVLEPPAFLDAKLPVAALGEFPRLENAGLRLITTQLLFSKPLGAPAPKHEGFVIHFAQAGDETPAAQLAQRTFAFSRFHLDPEIPNATAGLLKAEWVRNFFRGKRGSAMIVAKRDSTLAGFLLLLQGDSERLTIDLIAVAPEFQGLGLAKSMIAFAENHFQDFEKIQAGTQILNAPSLGLYQGLGFRLVESHYVFHAHLKEAP